MQNERIEILLQQLSSQQRKDYERLLTELSAHGGDLSKLSSADQETLATLSAAMNPETEITETETTEPDSELTAEVSRDEDVAIPGSAPTISPTTTPFGMYVYEQLQLLCEGGSTMADAVRYGFHNKYLPVGLRDAQVCQQIYQRHRLEIDELTASIQSVNKEQPKETHVIVGLAWFTMLYQCYQYVEAYGDLH